MVIRSPSFTLHPQPTLEIIVLPFSIENLWHRLFLISLWQAQWCECGCAPTVVNPLSVSIQASGTKRLILDLQYPNQFIRKSKINENHALDAKTMLYSFIDCSQNWLFSFDIKPGYQHIDIFSPDQEFLGFSWSKDGVIRFCINLLFCHSALFPPGLIFLQKF